MMYSSYNESIAHDPVHRRQQTLAGSAGVAPADFGVFDADGRRIRKPVHRRTVDHTSPAIRYIQTRMWQRDWRDSTALQPTPSASIDLLPPVAYADCPASSFATKFVHASTNKVRCSINKVVWTPQGRRLITGSQNGEFTLWNGTSFNFEMILQAHDEAIGAMIWSHNENWMVTGDEGGWIKYWQQNMNNVKANKGHKEAVRDLSFSSTDLKFCSCSDDGTVKVWDFARCQEERSLAGHGWDVKSVDWHPQKSLLVSGGKDHLVKLWDAKTGRELCTLHGHKNIVLSVRWNGNGNWVLTASKDQIIKLYDIRTLKELESYRGHQKDVTSLAWHPFHEELFVSGSYDGTIMHWIVGHEVPQAEVTNAHENSVWDLAWHPMGHILCSGSNDHTTKFWCRNRPGDPIKDKLSSYFPGGLSEQISPLMGNPPTGFQSGEGPITPGAFVAGGPTRGDGTIPGVGMAMPLVQSSIEAGISLDTSQQQTMLGGMPPGLVPRGPQLPSSPYPSLMASNLQQAQMQQPLHASQQPVLLPLQQSQQHQVQILPPPPPLPPPRPMGPPMAQQPPLPHGLVSGNVPSESLHSRPILSQQSSASVVMSGQMTSMISMQGLPQATPQLGASSALGVPSVQPVMIPQFPVPGSGGEFMVSGGMQSGGLPLNGGQSYRANLGGMPSVPSNMMNPHGSGPYTSMSGPPLLNPAAATPDGFQGAGIQGMMDVRNIGNMGVQMNMGINMPHHPQRPG